MVSYRFNGNTMIDKKDIIIENYLFSNQLYSPRKNKLKVELDLSTCISNAN